MLSIIVIFHNMEREARRTLYSLSCDYQIDVDTSDYEVIAIDNGSEQPMTGQDVTRLGPNFYYHYFDTVSPSPVQAINHGASLATGNHVAVIIDGARMASPGLVRATIDACRLADRPFVCALAWHLGPKIQELSIHEGYSRQTEDELLESINWRNSGYRLFDIASLASSSAVGLGGGLPVESSWLAVHRDSFDQVGGFDERFQTPGGGLASHDFQKRILETGAVRPFVLLGEGTFHQVHGGIATNAPKHDRPHEMFNAEYRAIRGRNFSPCRAIAPVYHGEVRPEAERFRHQKQPWFLRLVRSLKARLS